MGKSLILQTAGWKQIHLPHDWSALGDFSQTNASCTGFLPGGIGWYRKSFDGAPNWADRKVLVTFDGVYRNAEVWINGHELGTRPSGYSTFQYDLTPFLMTNGPNVLAVRVERRNVADSRFYAGSGIYRDVWLTVCDPVHVGLWGNYVTTPRVDDESAEVVVRTEVTNETSTARMAEVRWQIVGPDGRMLDEKGETHELGAGGGYTFSKWQKVLQPRLWSTDSPALYTMTSRVLVDGMVKDETRTRFGIRSIWFEADRGFSERTECEIEGVCMHEDGGVVGVAVPADVLAHRLKLLKSIGVNAVRCAHNPMKPQFYDLCDELGLLVMDEAFDEWEIGKRKWVEGRNMGAAKRFGYSTFFAEWAERDCADMVRRDRNHPSVILWSIGNEIDYPTDPYVLSETRTVEGFSTASGQPKQTRLAVLAPKLIAAVKREDPTRPVTMALANMVSSDATGLAQMLDVVGYNYQDSEYETDHRRFPTRVIYGSETGGALPQWKAVTDNAFIAGQFVWTGFDFLGEAGAWPNHGSLAGLFDTRGAAMVGAMFRRALWTATPTVALVVGVPTQIEDEREDERERRRRFGPNWTWPEGTGTLRVIALSNCERVELQLNGRSLDNQAMKDGTSAVFDVKYQAGELTAVGFRGGVAVATNRLISASVPVAIKLETDRTVLPADGRSVVRVIASVVDKDGNVVYPAASRFAYCNSRRSGTIAWCG